MTGKEARIEELDNGYLVTLIAMDGSGFQNREAFATLEEVFRRLLSWYEGRWPEGAGATHGEVTIQRGKESP
jgi:hypothetical protein